MPPLTNGQWRLAIQNSLILSAFPANKISTHLRALLRSSAYELSGDLFRLLD